MRASRTLLTSLLSILALVLWVVAGDEPELPAPPPEAPPRVELERQSSELAGAEHEPSRERASEPEVEPELREVVVSSPSPPAEPPPMETGPGQLTLSVVARECGALTAATLTLWRLGLPADEIWNAGDEQRGKFHAQDGTLVLSELPLGRYRCQVYGSRAGSTDNPEFWVGETPTRVTLWLEPPRERPVQLSVFDEQGRELDEVEWFGAWRGTTSRRDPHPSWARRRWMHGQSRFGMGGSSGFGYASRLRNYVSLPRENGVFVLPPLPEDTLSDRVTHSARLQIPGHERVSLRVSGAELEEHNHYVLVLPDRDRILEHIRLPDGGDGAAIESAVFVYPGHARVEGGEQASDAWRRAQVRVRVNHAEHVEVDVTYAAAEGPPLIELRALEQE